MTGDLNLSHKAEIWCIGDVHGTHPDRKGVTGFQKLTKLVTHLERHHNPTLFVQVGDFGYFPDLRDKNLQGLWYNPTDVPFVWIDGNHENFDALPPGPALEAKLETWYIPRGTVWKGLGFMGGATSRDKAKRIQGVSWWPQENITQRQGWDLINNWRRDTEILITHDCPAIYYGSEGMRIGNTFNPNARIIEALVEELKPRLLVCGHHHRRLTYTYKDHTRIEILDTLTNHTTIENLLRYCTLKELL